MNEDRRMIAHSGEKKTRLEGEKRKGTQTESTKNEVSWGLGEVIFTPTHR